MGNLSSPTPDATTGAKGKLQLAGDLGGTASLPSVLKINGITVTSSTGTFTLTTAKTFAVTNTLTLSGTDGTVMTFPSTTASVARIDAGQTFTGTNTFSSNIIVGTTLDLSGSISGTSKLIAPSTGGGTLTLPQGADTLMSLASIQTVSAVKTFSADPVIAQFGTASGLGAASSTWSPTVTASTGTITTATGSGRYKVFGKWTAYSAILTITTNGTGAGSILFTLPNTAQVSTNGFSIGSGRENVTSGSMVAVVLNTATQGKVFTYNNTYPGATGAIIYVSGVYET